MIALDWHIDFTFEHTPRINIGHNSESRRFFNTLVLSSKVHVQHTASFAHV